MRILIPSPKLWHCLLLVFTLVVAPLKLQAQQKKPELKVGLVLSGGGAKGFAHIGALKVIEESGVKIDYIAGTSMGAIVGALYASGYSAKELDSIFSSVDFDHLIQDALPRSAKTFYEKEDQERYAVTLPFDAFKIQVPQAMSKGQNIYNLFSQLLYHVRDVSDFKNLPIPFFCIATDVETGQMVTLDKGYLAEAISASGAFPSLFEPVVIGDKLLIDGGVTNNYPIQELKQAGATTIIGVDVQSGLATREELSSAPAILLQINNYHTVHDMQEKQKQTDIYIRPDITGFSVVSFDKGREIIERGQVAAKKHSTTLAQLAKRQNNREVKKQRLKKQDSICINSLRIKGNNRYSRAYIRGKLRLQPPQELSFSKLQQGISNLSATNNFNAIRYKLLSNYEDDSSALELDLLENKNTMFFRMGAHYDGLYKSGALLNITKKNLFFHDDVASLDVVLGDNLRYNFEYYLDKGFYWSLGVKSRLNKFKRSIESSKLEITSKDNLNQIDVSLLDITNQFYLQTVFKQEFTLGLGLEHKALVIDTKTILADNAQTIYFENNDYFSTYGYLTLDTYDSKFFPTKGVYLHGDFHLYFHATDRIVDFREFSIAKAKLGFATKLSKPIAFNFYSEGGFKLGTFNTGSLDFILGGYGNTFINNFTPFLGYDFLSFSGDSFVKSTARLDYNFWKKHHLLFSANYANAGYKIFDSGQWFSLPSFSGYALGYSVETFLGPIELKYSWSPELPKGFWFANLGFWF